MSFFRKIFGGGGSPLSIVRRALDQNRWADAMAEAESVDRSSLSEEDLAELDLLALRAGDGLATLNLSEAEGCLRAGDRTRAMEHLLLARDQVRGEELRGRIEEALGGCEEVETPSVSRAVSSSSCGGCSSGATASEPVDDEELDSETRMELILASYPEDLAARYQNVSDEFREAFLLAHEGRDGEAADLFGRIAAGAGDDLRSFELGSCLLRLGEGARGIAELEKAVAINPGHLLAWETLVGLDLASGREDNAEKRLGAMLALGLAEPFCRARLALVYGRKGKDEEALKHALRAIELGFAEPETVLLAAGTLERSGRLGEAEAVLSRLSSGGCCGGPNVPLAEFWLRHGMNPDKAMETFKKAIGSEPENPRWPYQLAKAYLARGWKKDGISLLEKVLSDPRLAPEMVAEGKSLMEAN